MSLATNKKAANIVVTQEDFETILRLSRDLQKQGCYLQAAKCLEAACTSTSQVLPASIALACLDYAQLLLDHFDNLDLAKALLLKAERELRSSRTQHNLKCEVYHHLIRCHRASNDLNQAIEAAKSGLALCPSQQGKKDLTAAWRIYFYFRLAECNLDFRGPESALSTLDSIDPSSLSSGELALLSLSRSVAHLHASDYEATDHHLTACATALEAALDKDESEMIQQMRAQYFLLYAIVAQAVGRAGQLQQENDYPVFSQLQEALAAISSPPQYNDASWLPAPAAAALGHILHAAVLRAAGRGSAAAMQLGQAEEIVENVLSSANIDCFKTTEADIPRDVRRSMHIYIHLRALAGEHRALAALLSTDFPSAARHISQCASTLRRFPSLLKDRMASLCMIAGHYAHSTTEYSVALRLYDAVAVHSSTVSSGGGLNKGMSGNTAVKKYGHRSLANISYALSEMHQGQGPDVFDSVRRRFEAQQLDGVSLKNAHNMPTHEKASAQLVTGIMLYQQNDVAGARLLLTKALKQAHGLIGSTQLVGQILNVLAPVQQERQDYSGAAQMFESATTLLKSVGDLPSLVTTLRGLHELHKQQGNEEMAVKSEQYLKRKADDLDSRIEHLKSSEEHSQVMGMVEWMIAQL